MFGLIQASGALCHEITHALVDAKRHVAPELLLLGWLRDSSGEGSGDRRRESWLEILSALPYWPVGLDSDGKWV